jgi:hypothetical protein
MSRFQPGNKVGHQFQPGISGNTKGRPPIIAEVRELARKHTKIAIRALVRIVKDEKSPPAAVVAAAAHLLDRAYGKPPVAIEHTGNTMLQVITGILRSPDQPLVIEAEAPDADEVRH